mgnify:CR=1 FL=1
MKYIAAVVTSTDGEEDGEEPFLRARVVGVRPRMGEDGDDRERDRRGGGEVLGCRGLRQALRRDGE